MLIACDVDAVVLNLHVEWLRRANEEYDDDMRYEDWTSYSPHKNSKAGTDFYKYLHDTDLYENVQPTPGAVEGIMQLREDGHRIVFATACVLNMCDQKYLCMAKHGFFDKPTDAIPAEYVVIRDKWLLAADLLIDDRASFCADWVEHRNKPAILYDRPWNQAPEWQSRLTPWIHRAENWKEIVEKVRSS